MTPEQVETLMRKADRYFEGDQHKLLIVLTDGSDYTGAYEPLDNGILSLDIGEDTPLEIDVTHIILMRFY